MFARNSKGAVIKCVKGPNYLFLSQYHVGSESWSLVKLRRQLLQAYMSIRSAGQVCDTLKTNAHPNFIVSREFSLPLLLKVTLIIVLTLNHFVGLDSVEQEGESVCL